MNGETGPLRIPTESFERWLFGRSAIELAGGSESVVAEPLTQSVASGDPRGGARARRRSSTAAGDVHAFVRSPESGVCYQPLASDASGGIRASAGWRTDDLARVRATSGRVDGRRDRRGDAREPIYPRLRGAPNSRVSRPDFR